jgi:hypothetical protein
MSSKRRIVCGDGTWNDADSAGEFYNVIERSTVQEPFGRRWNFPQAERTVRSDDGSRPQLR